MWTDRLISTADLVDVLTEVKEQVAIVITLSNPLEFTHRELRSELESSFARVTLRSQTREAVTSNHKSNLIVSVNPSWIATSSTAIGNSNTNLRLDKDRTSLAIKGIKAQWLRVNAESKTAITLELIASQSIVSELERTSSNIVEVFFDIGIIAESLNLVNRSDHHKEVTSRGAKWLSKQIFAKERSELVESFEIHLRIRERIVEFRVNGLRLASDKSVKGKTLFGQELYTRAIQKSRTDIRVHDLEDAFFQSHLGLEICTFERSARSFYADTRTTTTQRLQLVGILGRANFVSISTSSTKRDIIAECRICEAGLKNCSFLNNRADNIRDIRNRSTLEDIHVRRFASKNLANLSYNSVCVFCGEILNRRQVNTIVCHNIYNLSLCFVMLLGIVEVEF